MNILPNLSNLHIGIPQNDALPKFTVELRKIEGRNPQTQTIGIREMYQLFAQGATFSCIDKQIVITPTVHMEESDKALFQHLLELSQNSGDVLDVNREEDILSGSWNLGLVVSKADEQAGGEDVLGQRASILMYSNMQAAQMGVLQPVEKVFVRMSRDEEVFSKLYLNIDPDFGGVNQMMFQELYLTLYAAQQGIGVDVYAARGMQQSYKTASSLPRVVYFLQAADGELNDFCSAKPGSSPSTQACVDFYELVQKASASRMLLIDLKPGNAVYMKRPNGGFDFRLIDFGADYSVILPKERFSTKCIHFANCSMFASFVISDNNLGQILAQRLSKSSLCLARFGYLPYKFVSQYLAGLEANPLQPSSEKTFCTALLMARVTEKQQAYPFDDSMLDMVYNYTESNSIRALISEYLFVYDAYVSNKTNNGRPGGRTTRTIFRPGESLNYAGPFLKQMLAIVIKRFGEIEAIGVFDDLKTQNVESESSGSSGSPHTPQRMQRLQKDSQSDEDANTPLDPWIKDRDGNMDSDYELTPKDAYILKHEAKQKLEEARIVREKRRLQEGDRGQEERDRKKRDLKRTPMRPFELPDDEEMEVLLKYKKQRV